MTHWKVCDILKTLQGGTTSKSWLKNQKDSLTIQFKKKQWLSGSKRNSDYLVQKETVTIDSIRIMTSNSIRVSDYWFNKNYD